ncbi:MAG: FliM/FliN family flagellar motor switch protein [Acidobacteria bacterium]|jgi:flagellar motor switch protein FliN/FliY|nr:FliM/FliN family flagellar motor switch protein [Acidobacteriota bacterium]
MTPMEEIAKLADVPVLIEVEIGRPMLKLGDILALEEGSVVALPRSAGENIDIRVGGVLVCYGEVIVMEDLVGVRITGFKGE